MSTFAFNPGDPAHCSNCSRTSEEHEWQCEICGQVLPSGTCGCGAMHMPDGVCSEHPNGSARLRCRSGKQEES